MSKNISVIMVHAVAIILVIVLIGTMGILADARSGSDPNVDKFTGVLEQDVTIRILENDTAKEQGYLAELLDAFNAEYAEYGIRAVDANADQYTDLEKSGPYGFGPDILYQANDALMKYVDGRHIQPLPRADLDDYDKIDDEAWGAYQRDISGQKMTFGVPVNIQGPVLYYRKDLLPANWQTEWDDNGNNIPDMTENWCDLYEYSKQVKTTSAGNKFGYMKSLFDSYFASGYLFTYGAYVFGGENGDDTKDIGFSNGESVLGAQIINQLASVMNEGCIDDTITKNAYSQLAKGTYFATMTTPDVYTLFIKEMTLEYKRQGVASKDAEAKAIENLVVADVPLLPKSGNLEDDSKGFVNAKMMGGVNGYAMSSYTKSPNASLAFINFATSYEMIKRRNQLLGISPARVDIASEVGGLAEIVNSNLADDHIYVMPSLSEIAQVWTPSESFYADIAKDAFRDNSDKKYSGLADYKAGLEKVDEQVYSAIHLLN